MRARTSWGGALGVLALVSGLLAACAAPSAPAAPAASGSQSTGAVASGSQATTAATGGSQAAPAPPQKVRAAYVAIASNMLPAWLALDEGLYQKYGLDVELSYIAGAAKISEAVMGGDLDFGVAPASSAIGPGLEGADTVMLASWTSKLSFSALVQASIPAATELRDKRIGVTRRGSNSEIWANAVLGKFGLQPDRDYTVLSVGGQTEQLAALQNGALDAAILTPPTNLVARQMGFKELLSYKDYALDFANVGVVTTRRYLQAQPDVADRFLRASAEGVAMMLTNDAATRKALTHYTEVDDPAMLDETIAFEFSRTARDMLPTPEGMRGAMEELANNNPKAVGANPDDFLDLGPVKRLNDSGFIASLYR
ncbi:MAG TPA: ABC transporter substrate-binding protein [Chloroflexota bacterium]|jgi:ABC-type nitrate/sulfonate/bicarbonate transport system substrate-binding protein